MPSSSATCRPGHGSAACRRGFWTRRRSWLSAMAEPVAAVAIGRNEGDRLTRCLASLRDQGLSPVVYVDSGSTDGSVEAAQWLGAEVVELDLSVPFTAARARNAGAARVAEMAPDTAYIQFVDGDCELADGWISAALETFSGV